MMLNGKFSQPYSQHTVHVRAYVQSRLSFVMLLYPAEWTPQFSEQIN